MIQASYEKKDESISVAITAEIFGKKSPAIFHFTDIETMSGVKDTINMVSLSVIKRNAITLAHAILLAQKPTGLFQLAPLSMIDRIQKVNSLAEFKAAMVDYKIDLSPSIFTDGNNASLILGEMFDKLVAFANKIK